MQIRLIKAVRDRKRTRQTGVWSRAKSRYAIPKSQKIKITNPGLLNYITNELEMTLGIDDNDGAEFIAIEKTKKDRYRIVLSPLIDLDKERHIEIGNSFTDFLLRRH